MWAAIAVSLVIQALSFVFQTKPPKPRDAVAGNQEAPKPPQGQPIPVAFGPNWHKGPGVLLFGNREQEAIKSGGGGKK